MAQHHLTQIRKESNQLRTNYLLQRASAMDIANNTTARNTIININKIEKNHQNVESNPIYNNYNI